MIGQIDKLEDVAKVVRNQSIPPCSNKIAHLFGKLFTFPNPGVMTFGRTISTVNGANLSVMGDR